MKRLLMCVCVLSLGCPAPSEKSTNNVIVNNANNANNVGDAGNNQNNVSDVSVEIDFGVDPDGPQFVDVSVSPLRITEGESFSVLVQVTDPDGFDDIGGGRLTTLDGDAIGNFSGSGGSYSIDVNWSDVNAVDPITFATEDSRTFIAEFFDAGSHVSRAPIDVEFHCNGEPACEGVCGDELCNGTCQNVFEDDMNCGSCGNECVNGESCLDEQCQLPNFLNYCNSPGECLAPPAGFAECYQVTEDAPRCVVNCNVGGAECGADVCVNVSGDPNNPFNICLQECTGNAARCVDDLTCMAIGGGVSVCTPPVPN